MMNTLKSDLLLSKYPCQLEKLDLPPARCALLPGRRTGSPHLRLKPPEPSRALEPRLARLLLPHLAARPSASASPRCPLLPAVHQPTVVLPAAPAAAVPPPPLLLLLFHSCLLSSLHPFTHNWLFRRWQVWTFRGKLQPFTVTFHQLKRFGWSSVKSRGVKCRLQMCAF